MSWILFSLALGCAGTEVTTECSAITDAQKRDLCFHDELVKLPPSQIAEVISTAKKMEDAMVRGAAVAEWIKLYNNKINQQQGQELCKLLDGRDRSYCLRRLSSPHLKR